jgi:geranylgeranyl diphosphate synthase type II
MLKQLFDQYLNANNYQQKSPQELYEPIDYILGLGGKRIRPLSVLIACSLFSKEIEKALPAAYAIEVFHNFSLVHDDIMDKSVIRRGQPTVHKKWDDNTAILSGDVMLVYAYEHLAKLDPAILPIALTTFNEVAIGVCEGQQKDINFEERLATSVSIAEYIDMITLKTSVLIYGAMKIGALVGGANLENAERVAEFGKNLGIAFQLQDDYLDTFGETAKVGKRIGGDILQNKKTYLVIKALELANTADKATLLELLTQTVAEEKEEEKIATVTAIFHKLDIPKQMQSAIKKYNDIALQNLTKINVSEEQKQPLVDLLHQLMVREY